MLIVAATVFLFLASTTAKSNVKLNDVKGNNSGKTLDMISFDRFCDPSSLVCQPKYWIKEISSVPSLLTL